MGFSSFTLLKFLLSAVLITGGQKDEAKATSLAFGLLPLLSLCALFALLYVAVVKWQASVAGVALGWHVDVLQV